VSRSESGPHALGPSSDDLRWQELADELPFEQVENTRRQAEGWRNALIAATAIVGTVTVVHGRQDLSALQAPWRYTVIATLAAAFAALLTGTIMTTVAAHGRPGQRIWAKGEALRQWSARRARQAGRLTLAGAILCVLGINLVVAAAGITALAPGATTSDSTRLVTVQTRSTPPTCGQLIHIEGNQIVLRVAGHDGEIQWSVPLDQVVRLSPVNAC
jgi:hypothetical protein